MRASFRTAPSQLVATLRSYAWVPQQQSEHCLVFVSPPEARPERLPEGFAFDPGWAWVKATEFGEERRDAERKRAQETLDEETKVRKREAKAKELGFENLAAAEEGKWFAELPESERSQLRELLASKRRPPPDFPEPRYPERRRSRAKEQVKDAPNRKTQRRERSVVEGEAKLKEEARTKLRAKYEEHAHVSLCQVIGCQDRSFRLKEGAWYFEAVRFLGLNRMVPDDYVALCPRHAAMYQHAKESDGLKQEFAESSAVGDFGTGLAIRVVLAGEKVDIVLAPDHVIDLRAAWEVDVEIEPEGD